MLVLGVAAMFRFWHLAAIGFNSDEAVYAGSAAGLSGDAGLTPMFPIFRAHPLLLQTLVALISPHGVDDWRARALCAVIGLATVAVTYILGARLYRRSVGLLAAAVLAVMPYHVVVSRQVLLDGLMTLGATVVLYCLARYAESVDVLWLVAGASVMGLTVLAKETSLVLLGGAYAFFALTPKVRV
jgi:4-amino-4-deoxy-L-arabinose transferase-like glycosyltransferase